MQCQHLPFLCQWYLLLMWQELGTLVSVACILAVAAAPVLVVAAGCVKEGLQERVMHLTTLTEANMRT